MSSRLASRESGRAQIAGLEAVHACSGRTGNSQTNLLAGNRGNDLLTARAALTGNTGDDVLDGGRGGDKMR